MSIVQTDNRPHNVSPTLATTRVVFAMKNFSSIPGVCHLGLTISMGATMKVLRRHGVHCDIWPVKSAEHLKQRLAEQATKVYDRVVTHVIVSSPAWVQPPMFLELCGLYPEIEFVQLNHSGCAYLSIDKFGIRNIRECIDAELTLHNMRVASNNERVANALTPAFGSPCLLLTNLYDTDSFVTPYPARRICNTIKIGCFGASRPWKNQLTAALAAVQLARRLGVHLELYVNSKRPDGGERMIESRQELFHNLPGCKLIEVPWAMWPRFRDITATMDILFQPSFDETFNVVTADGIAEGVPSVTAPSIEWTPQSWWCQPADPTSLANTAITLLHDPNAVDQARVLLKEYVARGVTRWLNYLDHK
jgi:glycosyltransferase involved in cell wall biosynthesis